ncbi:non-ribosomal peptide synthetase, partial [Clostridium frigidicarnis]
MERNINIDIVSNMMQREREFWKSKLNNEFIKTTMPFKNYESNEGYTNKVTVHGIKEDNFRKIQKICRNSQEKIFMFLYSTLVVLAYKYTNNKYIAIESPIFKQKEDKNVMNSVVPFFEEILGTYTFKEVLLKAKSTIEQSYENGSYPINKIYDLVDEVNYDKESPLTDIVFLMDNLQDKKLIENLNGRLSFIFSLEEYGIYLTLQYNKEFYINEATNKIFEHIENILESVLNNVEIQIDQIDILSKEEKELLLVGFNETKKEYFMEKTIQELFEEQVKKTPNKVALKFDGRKITYDKLNQKANALSKVLRKKGVKSDDIVGIFLQRSEDMIVAMLAILKSGAAYLPIDPNYPIDRINFILEDSRAPIVITGSKWKSHVTYDGMIVNIDEIEVDRDSNNPIVLNNSNDLAYVIYTSGSTGNPKGVMIEHKQVNNFIEGVANETNIIKHESILCITTISFDIFVLETLLPITKGLTVSITKDDISIDGDLIGEIIEKDDIKVIQSTPSRMKLFLQSSRFRKSLEKVKVLLIGGDTLPITLLNELKKYSLDIYNMYGPTETTVWSTIRKIENEDRINIGKPIQNTKVYILDKRLTLRPIGAIGEVYISGDGIGRGYLNNEKLTEQKFILNPFECNEKMYSTGDVGRWLPDGNIELLGRIDYQVKIRGFRIELGEIESNLQKLDGIKEAVVLAKGEITNQYLCAYYESEEKYSSYELKDFLEKDLPEYMMPSYFIYLQSMPLTPNGKIDRKQLLKIEEKIDSIDEYVAPTNKIEKKLVEIFEEVLQIKNIGINDNIFNTGAHSLTVAILVGKIYKEFNVEISMKEIFMLQTIKEIAQCIESKENRIFQGIETIEKREYYEASSSQKRMYIIQDFDKENVAYNMPCIFEVQGSIDKSKIEDTFKKLVLRHEALRTYFEIVDGEIVQKVVSDYEFSLNSRRETKPIEIVIENFIKPFDLRKLPLFRIE